MPSPVAVASGHNFQLILQAIQGRLKLTVEIKGICKGRQANQNVRRGAGAQKAPLAVSHVSGPVKGASRQALGVMGVNLVIVNLKLQFIRQGFVHHPGSAIGKMAKVDRPPGSRFLFIAANAAIEGAPLGPGLPPARVLPPVLGK